MDEVKKVLDVGVDAIIVQGHEAGGHVMGQVWISYIWTLLCKN